MSKKKKIGLFGFGNVGQGFCELLEKSKNLDLEIKAIAIKDPSKTRGYNATKFTTSIHEIIDDPEIDIVVELIDDPKVAFEILKRSLINKKPVVTANKKMLADNLKEVYQLQAKYQTPVLYEGAVCGSIPIIRNLENYYALDCIEKIEGIFNGSTNYILTKMTEEKIRFSEALKHAKQLGFAESDPTLDINGSDAKYKLAILIAHAFHLIVDPVNITTIGIDKITQNDIRFARQQGCSIKLIAKCEKIGNKLFAIVAPQFVPQDDPLAQIKNEFNGVRIIGGFAGAQQLNGKGAGSLPTGLAVLSDVASLSNQFQVRYRPVNHIANLSYEVGTVNVHVRFESDEPLSSKDFVQFQGGFRSNHYQTMEGWVTTNKLLEWRGRDNISIILKKGQNIVQNTTQETKEIELV